MKNKASFRKILSLLLSLVLLAGIIPAANFTAEAANSYDVWFLRNNPNEEPDYSSGITYPITYANGKTSPLKGIVTIETINNHLAYCIDPGTRGGGYTSGDYTLDNSDASFNTFSEAMSGKYAGNGAGLSTKEIYDLLRIAISYGFSSNDNPTSWGEKVIHKGSQPDHDTYFPRSSGDKIQNLYKALATQVILQEIASGERKTDFSHYDGNIYLFDQLIGFSSSPKCSYASQVKGYYDSYVAQITEAIANKNKTPTTTTEEHTASVEKNTKIDLGTLELKPDGNGMFTAEKKFSELSFVLDGTDIATETKRILTTSLPGVTLSADGETIKISMDLETAFEYQNNSYPVKITKSANVTVDDGDPVKYPYRYAKTMTLYVGSGIQAKTCITGDYETRYNEVQNKKTHIYNYEFNLSVKVPIVHTHKWLPHVTEPTCTTEGLTCYFCTCGMMYTYANGVSDSITGEALKDGGIEDALGHDYENGTWVISVPATCTTAGEEKLLCGRCGEVIDSREISAFSHDTAPEDGGKGVWVITKQPKSTAQGTKSLYCTKCGTVIDTAPIDNHKHISGDTVIIVSPTCVRNGVQGTFCAECNACISTETIAAGHSAEPVWYTAKQATCTQNGQQIGICADCGTKLATREITAEGHGDTVDMVSVAPTCTEQGEQISYCKRCGEIINSKPLDCLGHDEGVWTVSLDPTCEADGEKIRTCTRCGEVVESESIPALGHDENGVWKIDVPATPDHQGTMSEYCTKCGMVLQTESFSMHEHEFGYSCVLLQPTCVTDGELASVCAKCNAAYEVTAIPASGHKYQEASYISSGGTHSRVCENCRHILTENHSFETVASVQATCSTAGYRSYKCSDCGYCYTDSFTAPTGHSFGRWTPDDGGKTHTRCCNNPGCGVFEQQLHIWSNYELTEEATMTNGRIRTRTCTVCGATDSYEGEDSIVIIIEKSYAFIVSLLKILIAVFNILSILMRAIGAVV